MSLLSTTTALTFYSLAIDPLLQYSMLGFLCTPSYFVPLGLMNAVYNGEYKHMFYAKRDMCVNLWLLPSGKQVIADTLEGKARTIEIKDFYKHEYKKTRFRLGNRLELYHGANNYLFFSGNHHTIDHEVLNSVMNKSYVDTKNVSFDIDTNKSFTWEIDKLMRSDIKKYHKRITLKYLNPLSPEERKNKELKLKAIYKLRKRLRNLSKSQGLNHNFYKTMKAYEQTRKWADYNLSRLQGSIIQFTKELDNDKVNTYNEYPPQAYDKLEFEQREAQEQDFLNKRKSLLRRPRGIKKAL